MTRAVVVLVLAVLVAACGSGNSHSSTPPTTIGRGGSKVVTTVAAVPIGAPLDTYSVRYRVEEVDGDDVSISTSTLTVDRPFRSRIDLGRTTRRADFGYLGTDQEVVTAAPAPAPVDVRSDLLFGGDKGREVRSVAGRDCQVHRLGAPVLSGIVVPAGESEGVTADDCVDADGLILEEVVTNDDQRTTSRWIATKVDTAPTVAGDEFRIAGATPKPAAAGGGSLQEVDPTSSSLGRFWQLDEPPAGFIHHGRYAIVPPQSASTDDIEVRGQVVAGVSDVYVRGIDVVIVEQGGTLGQVPPFGVTPYSRLIDLGELGRTAEWFLTPSGAEVHVLIPPGRYVKVLGTMPAPEVIAIARSLTPIEGTGLVYRSP